MAMIESPVRTADVRLVLPNSTVEIIRTMPPFGRYNNTVYLTINSSTTADVYGNLYVSSGMIYSVNEFTADFY